mmetsp:Transcript_41282/g.81449  ORF Transcript_41282/g.81449 Transcript_41282/m.81449 type:complete len:94 (+) Transcript_41282:125-406(+)
MRPSDVSMQILDPGINNVIINNQIVWQHYHDGGARAFDSFLSSLPSPLSISSRDGLPFCSTKQQGDVQTKHPNFHNTPNTVKTMEITRVAPPL